MLIYLSHPYGGKPENKASIEAIITRLIKEHPEHTYISPVHTFGFMYDLVDYQAGLDMCLDLLNACEYMYVYGNHKDSRGCTAEIKYAQENGIPFSIINK